MPPRTRNVDYMDIQFRDEEQRRRFETLSQRQIISTRYSNDPCLRALGLYDSVHFMYDRLQLSHFMNLRHRTYSRLTLEFLSSLDFNARGNCGDAIFRMFDKEYALHQDEIGDLFHFDAVSELCITAIPSVDSRYAIDFCSFWQRLTGERTASTKGRKSSHIHNPAIRYFQKVLAHTIFGRGDSSGNVNSEELYFIDAVFRPRWIHSAAFMLAKMQKIATATTGAIAIGGLITSLAIAMGLENEVATLDPIPATTPLDQNSCLAQKLIKYKGQSEYFLMIKSQEIPSIVLPNPDRINVQDERNWLFPMDAPADTTALPTVRATDSPEDADTDVEMDRSDTLFYDMHHQQLEMMEHMRAMQASQVALQNQNNEILQHLQIVQTIENDLKTKMDAFSETLSSLHMQVQNMNNQGAGQWQGPDLGWWQGN